MSKYLESILIPTEDVLRILNDIDYESTGKLRTAFTKRKMTKLRISPSSDTELWYREVERVGDSNENS
jgi:hypothetical protein